MSFLLPCPNCGPRDVNEFAYAGEVTHAAEGGAVPARADGLRVLPPQRRRRPAGVVVPPLRLRALVPGRARHAHERGPAHRNCRRRRPRRPARSEASRHSRTSGSTARDPSGSSFRRPRGRGVRGRHDRLGAVRGGPARLLAQLQVPPAARAALLLRRLPELHDDRRRRAERPRVRRAGARGRAGARRRTSCGSLEHDLLAVVDTFGGPFTPVGFYYRTMIRPREPWPLYEKFLRNVAGLGRLDQHAAARAGSTPSTAAPTCS